jgi:nucleoside-diphosphate-sugar epimerase
VTIDREAAELDGSFAASIAALRGDAVIDLICYNVQSATQIVDALRGKVEIFAHCGTLWVHGFPKTRPYDESAPREPIGEYGISKADIERYLMNEASEGFPATILHPGHISGPGWTPINPAGNLDTRVFGRLSRGDVVTLADDGMSTLQHVHADDVAQAFELAIARPDMSIGEAFHVSAREPVTQVDYAKAVASWSGREAVLEFLPWEEWKKTVTERDAELTYDHMIHSPCASIVKAERLLGFAPRFSAVEAVHDALS